MVIQRTFVWPVEQLHQRGEIEPAGVSYPCEEDGYVDYGSPIEEPAGRWTGERPTKEEFPGVVEGILARSEVIEMEMV